METQERNCYQCGKAVPNKEGVYFCVGTDCKDVYAENFKPIKTKRTIQEVQAALLKLGREEKEKAKTKPDPPTNPPTDKDNPYEPPYWNK